MHATPEGPGDDPGRLRWRCRRGMKELDTLLLRWLEHCHACAGPGERAAFAAFLELPDPQLLGYLVRGETPAEARFRPLVGRILELRG